MRNTRLMLIGSVSKPRIMAGHAKRRFQSSPRIGGIPWVARQMCRRYCPSATAPCGLGQLQFHPCLLLGLASVTLIVTFRPRQSETNPFIGETRKLPTREFRNIRLRQSHYFGGLGLRESLLLDQVSDIDDQVGANGSPPHQVARCRLARYRCFLCLPAFSSLPSMAIRYSASASLSLERTFSISFSGVLIPCRDFLACST